MKKTPPLWICPLRIRFCISELPNPPHPALTPASPIYPSPVSWVNGPAFPEIQAGKEYELAEYPKYSIVIPAYNERARILATLESVVACVRAGLIHALGEIVMFTDADLSAPIEEAERLFAAIAAGADIAIGSRWLATSRQTHRQPLYRQLFGRCFNALTRAVMRLPYADTQCGFKAFTRDAAQTIFQLETIERWGFDPEILFIALKRGFRVVEVPVSWAHDERTRMSYLRDGFKMLEEIATIRWNALTGHYNKKIHATQRSGEA